MTGGGGAEVTAALDIDDLFRLHAQQVARWAARLLGPSSEVDDVVQEVFLVAHRKSSSFRGDSQITTWLFSITRNVVRHRQRRDKTRRLVLGWLERGADEQRPLLTPIEELERARSLRVIYDALAGLREQYRTVFVLHELEGLPFDEIATLTQTKPATLRVHLHRAREQVLAAMSDIERERPRALQPELSSSWGRR